MPDGVYEILLVEDNPGDVVLAKKALTEANFDYKLHVANDGEEALKFVRQEGEHANAKRPSIILLDLGLPKKHGSEVLVEIKTDPILRRIPIVVLTSSENIQDVNNVYMQHANAYITKPITIEGFVEVMRGIGMWLDVVMLPPE